MNSFFLKKFLVHKGKQGTACRRTCVIKYKNKFENDVTRRVSVRGQNKRKHYLRERTPTRSEETNQ